MFLLVINRISSVCARVRACVRACVTPSAPLPVGPCVWLHATTTVHFFCVCAQQNVNSAAVQKKRRLDAMIYRRLKEEVGPLSVCKRGTENISFLVCICTLRLNTQQSCFHVPVSQSVTYWEKTKTKTTKNKTKLYICNLEKIIEFRDCFKYQFVNMMFF